MKKRVSAHELLKQIEKYGFGILKFLVITLGYPNLHCKASPIATPPDGNCLMHAIADFLLSEIAGKERHESERNVISLDLSRDLELFNESDHDTTILRKRWVFGAFDWLAGKNGSRENLKNIFQYTDDEWAFVWSTLIHDKSWNVPNLKDKTGSILKENFGPEMLIKYIAHDIRCHIIVFDLQLEIIQFCSGNYLKENNVIYSSPIIMYCTGNHFQLLLPLNPAYFRDLVTKLENGEDVPTKLSYIESTTFDGNHHQLENIPNVIQSKVKSVPVHPHDLSKMKKSKDGHLKGKIQQDSQLHIDQRMENKRLQVS